MKITKPNTSATKALFLATACLFFMGIYVCGAQQSANRGATNHFKQGSTLPVYLHEVALAEATTPTIELAEGASFWRPGPERFYGYALRDLSDYLQQMTGAKYPLTAANANARSGIFAGTFDQFPGFEPQQAEAHKAMASDDPEAFVVEVQDDRLYILAKSNLGLIAGIYTLLDKLGAKWFAPGQEWENVPTLSSLSLDSQLNVASTGPSYNLRLFFPSFGVNTSMFNKGERETAYTLWNLRNRMGGSGYVANYLSFLRSSSRRGLSCLR